MRTAEMKVTNWGGKDSVIVTLQWHWLGVGSSLGRWYCLPGYLAASSGYWQEHPLTNRIRLYDDDDNIVAWTATMDVDWTGYPLSDLKGATGPFTAERGGIIHDMPTWELLSV